jgi:hypothetical protein
VLDSKRLKLHLKIAVSVVRSRPWAPFPPFHHAFTDRPISDNTLNAALRRLGYAKDEATAHGFRRGRRSSFRPCRSVRVLRSNVTPSSLTEPAISAEMLEVET